MKDRYDCHHYDRGFISRAELLKDLQALCGRTLRYTLHSRRRGFFETIDPEPHMVLLLDATQVSPDTFRLEFLDDRGMPCEPLVGNGDGMAYLLSDGTASSGPNSALDKHGEIRMFKLDR